VGLWRALCRLGYRGEALFKLGERRAWGLSILSRIKPAP
jgi:hypothetical protein